jgi:tetratricopeptide (TPR) repeat protein
LQLCEGDAASKVERQFGLSVENFQKAFDTDKTPTAQQWQDRADAYASLEKYLPAGSSDFNRAVKDALECYHHAAQDDLAVGNYKDAGAAYLGASHVYQTANDNKEASKLAKEAGGYFIDAATKQDLSNSNDGQNDLKNAYNAFELAASLETGSVASATWAAAKSALTEASGFFGGTTPPDTEREKLAEKLASQCPPTS